MVRPARGLTGSRRGGNFSKSVPFCCILPHFAHYCQVVPVILGRGRLMVRRSDRRISGRLALRGPQKLTDIGGHLLTSFPFAPCWERGIPVGGIDLMKSLWHECSCWSNKRMQVHRRGRGGRREGLCREYSALNTLTGKNAWSIMRADSREASGRTLQWSCT